MKLAPSLAVLAIFALALSCAQPPKAEADAARAAVAAAQGDPDIVAYSPDTLRQATDDLAQMEQFLKDRRYPEAKAAANQAASLADSARQEVAGAKLKVKNDATDLISGAKQQLAALLPTLSAAKRVKHTTLDFAALGTELAAAQAKLSDADAALAAGRFIDARDGATAVKAAFSDIEKRISDAIQAARKKK